MKPAWSDPRPDVLGDGWLARTLDLAPDASGQPVATLVHRADAGTRPRAMLYLHGYVDYFFQSRHAQEWAEHGYDVYALELRDYGRSIRPGREPNWITDLSSYDEEIDAALAFVRAQGHEIVVLDGHSTGGLLAVPAAEAAARERGGPDCRHGRTRHRWHRTARATADRPPPGGRAHGQADVAPRHRPGRRAGRPGDRPRPRAALAGAEVIVHAASDPRGDPWQVDVAGTRRLVQAVDRDRLRHLVYVSSVGVDRIPFGYYRAKFAAEQVLLASGLPVTLLRVTHFHHSVDVLLETARRGPVLPVPMGWKAQPVDVGEVAAHIVTVAAAPPAGDVVEYGGPEELSAADLARAWVEARVAGDARRVHTGAGQARGGVPGRRGRAHGRRAGTPHLRRAPARLTRTAAVLPGTGAGRTIWTRCPETAGRMSVPSPRVGP